MPLLALRKFRSHISKKYFYTCGIKIASHPYYILCISLFIICFISYSVFIDYITTPHSLSPPLIDAHLWQFSSHLQQQQQQVSESESFIAQQIRVVSLEHTVSKQLLRETLAIYQSLTVSNQLKTICATTQQRQCLVHSILSLWDYSQQKIDTDTDIIATINQHGVSKTTGLSLHPYTTLGNVSLDSHGSLLSADSIILTFILKNTSKTQDTWDQLWQRSVSSKTTFKLDIEPCWIQYKLKLLTVSPITSLVVILSGIGLFFLVKHQFTTNSKLIKSTSGLGITILFLSFACYTTTVGIKLNKTPWWYLAVCTTATLEHALLLTRAVIATTTRDSMTVKERIAKGLQQAGVTMLTSLLSELCILGTGSLMKKDHIRSFCSFTAVALVVAFVLSLTFFVAVLSIDIRRAELTDLDNCNGFERRRRSSTSSASQFIYGQNFRSKRALNALFICIILFLLNVIPSNTNPGKELTPSIRLERSQWASISSSFWRTLNPTYHTQSLQVYAPSIVIATLNDGSILDHSNLVQDLTTYYTDKFTLLRQYLQVRSMQYSWLDTLHPYHLMAYLNHYTNLLPSAILLLVWIGIMLWMNTFVREQYMLPIMRVVFVRIVTLVLRIITRITFIQTDSLIRKVETEYNEDGMHLGAISLQSQFHLQQTRERVPNVSIRTLMGQHAADIKAMACHGAVETTRKLISTDQEGKLVLWNITAETETAIARLDLQRQLGGGLNGWVGTKQQQQGLNPIEMRQLPAARCVQMDSQGKLVIAGYDHGYISVWNAETAHVVRELSVQDPSGEYRNHRVLHLSFLEPNNGTKKKKSSSKYIFSVHKNGYLREWNIKTGEMIEAFDSNHKRDITVITILADNQHQHKLWVFTASKDGIVKCWERTLTAGHDMHPTTNWRCMYSIQAHHGHMITSLAAHQLHNGLGILVTGSNGGGVCVWQLANGKPLCTLSKDSNSSKTAAAGNQNDGLLLQFSKVEQQQGLQQQTQPQCLLAQADHGRSVSQVVITRLGCPEFDNDMCSHCQTTLNTGFLVASSALDDSVHCWRLDRMLSHENGCTQCIKEYRHRPYHSMAPVPPTAGPPRASQRKKHSNNNRDQSGDESEDEETQQPLSLSVSFLGKLDQADGRGLVFCDNMVLAGVRRRQTYLDTEDDGDDVGLWEAWFVSLQYYEPPPIKEEDAFAIPVITFDLEKDEDYYREIEEKELIDVQEMAKTNSLWDQILLSLFGIKKVRAAPWPTEASIAATRKRSYPSESLGNTSGYEEDDDAYEILPFSTIRLVMPMNGYGFCCDYGNFIKCISFENRHDVPSSTTSTSSR